MKKFTRILSIIAVAILTLASCQKDGEYNPANRIQSISRENSVVDGNGNVLYSIPQYVTEKWEWAGSKGSLTQITYFDEDGGDNGSAIFSYNSDKTINYYIYNDVVAKYTYENKKIAAIDYTYFEDENVAIARDVFTYNGKKLASIERTIFSTDRSFDSKALNMMLPQMQEEMTRKVTNSLKSTRATGDEMIQFDFEWTGNNISQVTIKDDEGTHVITYEYDANQNVYCGMRNLYDISTNSVQLYSKNNITKSVLTSGNETQTSEYTYEYDGKKLISSTCKISVDEYFATTTDYYAY